jgi:hypothetical protein
MTRAQYEAKYGAPPSAAAPVKMTQAQYDAKYAAKPTPTKSTGQKILDAGTSVANFFGAKGISEQFGADIARARAPEAEKNLVSYPSMKSVLGSALQTGANFVPGTGVGAGLTRKVATGAATGYAMDVGSKLQTNTEKPFTPGLGTAIGGALPIAGALTRTSNIASTAKKAANNLEKSNLRMTPVENQNLKKQGKDIANFLAKKKIIGTAEQRYAKVSGIYDDMERKITREIDGARVAVGKNEVLEEIAKIPEKYVDNLSEYDSVVSKVERIMETLKKNKGDTLTGTTLNSIKRNEWQNAYAKNNTDVVNEVSHDVGEIIKKILDKNVPGLSKLNDEYGMVIAAKRQLFKAQSRNAAGVFTRAAGVMGGSGLGAILGGPVGAGAGAYIGDKAANLTATPMRSVVGAGAQIASEAIKKNPLRGAVQPARKSLLQAIQANRPEQTAPTPEERTPLSPEIQSSPKPTIDPGRVNDDGSITVKGPVSGKDMTIDPMVGGGTAKAVGKAGVAATDIMKDALLSKLRQGAPKLGNALDTNLSSEAEEFVKFLQEIPNPTIAQMNKGLEILKRQGHDVSKISDDIIEATRREYEQARDLFGRFAKPKK